MYTRDIDSMAFLLVSASLIPRTAKCNSRRGIETIFAGATVVLALTSAVSIASYNFNLKLIATAKFCSLACKILEFQHHWKLEQSIFVINE